MSIPWTDYDYYSPYQLDDRADCFMIVLYLQRMIKEEWEVQQRKEQEEREQKQKQKREREVKRAPAG